MDGTPAEIFVQVDRLRAMGLTVPDTVSVLYELSLDGWNVPLDAMSVEECAAAIEAALKK